MPLTIPKHYRPALASLVSMSDALRQRFVNALRDAAPVASLRELARNVAERAGSDSESVYALTLMLSSLYSLREGEGFETATLVNDLIEAAIAQDDPSLRPASGDWEGVRQSLITLLESNRALSVTSKASEVLSEFQRRMCHGNCRVLSDIRPVFTPDVTARPPAAVIVHTLKLAYHEGDELKEFYVVLDARDIRELKSLLDRAIVKETTLSETVEATGVQLLGFHAHHH